MLHIHCGDMSAASLRQSGVPGETITWMDLLNEGPAPAVEGDAWRRLRADFLAGMSATFTPAAMLAHLERQDAALMQATAHDEVVLWFDACLYDQLILIRQLDWFSRQELGDTRLSLVEAGDFPGFTRFAGLGELSPEQMATLFPKRQPVTIDQMALARAAWAAFRLPEPTVLQDLLDTGGWPLPYLAGALRRHLQQFPSTVNGLNRMEEAALQAIAAGAREPGAVFMAASAQEHPPFFGDTALWWVLEGLAQAPHPLLTIDGPGPLPRFDQPDAPPLSSWALALTDNGHAVLAGDADAVHLNGIDCWRGGVYLHGPDAAWRWSPEVQAVVRHGDMG